MFFAARVVLVILVLTTSTHGALVNSTRLPLRTEGTRIVDNAGEHVHLACVNWYGQHMEQFATSGLHLHELSNLTSLLVDLGFNCVRLPVSLELFFENPVVRPEFVAANPSFVGLTALELLDEVVEELQRQDVLVMMNNHNSKAGWCCDVDSDEGIWDAQPYGTDQWIQGLAGYARRYVNHSNVIAMDLRNEIHDVGNRIVTWGASDDKNTDWKVATELAGAAVLDEAPDTLILVSGLCFSYDLRKLQADPPRLPVDNRLVYTVHTYAYSTWWGLVETTSHVTWPVYEGIFATTLATSVVGLIYCASTSSDVALLSKPRIALSLSWWAFGISCLFLLSGVLWREALRQGGCLAMATEANVTIGVCASLAVASLCFVIGALRVEKRSEHAKLVDETVSPIKAPNAAGGCGCCTPGCRRLNVVVGAVVVLVLSVPLLMISHYAQRYEVLELEFNIKWGTENTNAPIWLGEFGGNEIDSTWWPGLMRYVAAHDLDWAYWPYDGSTWVNETQSWKDETYGILEQDYQTVRHPEMLEDLQEIQ